MERRYHMGNGTQFIEVPETAIGFSFLKKLRKHRPDLFKGRRIRAVLQVYPDKVNTGEIHDYTYKS